MTLSEFYRSAVEVGMAADCRGNEALEQNMRDLRERVAVMSDSEKAMFDRERLTNPFGDTRIAFGRPDTELSRVLIGIDIDASELLLAAELSRRDQPVDAVIAHHASSIAGGMGSKYDTAIPQVGIAVEAGVPAPRAWKLVQEVIGTEDSSWNLRSLQVAEALDLPLMTVHSPADACLDELARTDIEREQPATVGALVDLVEAWPECRWLKAKARHGVTVDCGDRRAPLGRVYRCLYGGWNPTPALFEELCKAGVGTFLVVASSAPFRDIAPKYGASIVVIPHYPADNAGINIMLDRIMPDGDSFEIIPVSNYVRCRRPAPAGSGEF